MVNSKAAFVSLSILASLFLLGFAGILVLFLRSEDQKRKDEVEANSMDASRRSLWGVYMQQYDLTVLPQLGSIYVASVSPTISSSTNTNNVWLTLQLNGRKMGYGAVLILTTAEGTVSTNQWDISAQAGYTHVAIVSGKSLTLSNSTNTSTTIPPLVLYKISDINYGAYMQGVYRTSQVSGTVLQISVGYDFAQDRITVVSKYPSSSSSIVNYGTSVPSGDVIVNAVSSDTFTYSAADQTYSVPYKTGVNTVVSGTLVWNPQTYTIQLNPSTSASATTYFLNLDLMVI